MQNTFGTAVRLTLFGESHGEAIGCVLDGLPAGIPVQSDIIAAALDLRRPNPAFGGTLRIEPDNFSILSGVANGFSTGAPLCILIPNTAAEAADYKNLSGIARPGHADYPLFCKYGDFAQTAGGGHQSGRLTAALVAACAVLRTALEKKNIFIGTHIADLGGICDRGFEDMATDISQLRNQPLAVLSAAAAQKMQEKIAASAAAGDSIGGVLETAVTGVPAGLGEPWFDSAESLLAHALFSIPAVKGVQFGLGFDDSALAGSRYNDAYCIQNGKIVTATNHNGGIGGGITNGMPLLFRCAVKPTPSIAQPQKTVRYKEMQPVDLQIAGRHDTTLLPRVRAVVDSMTAFVLFDLATQQFGRQYFNEAGL